MKSQLPQPRKCKRHFDDSSNEHALTTTKNNIFTLLDTCLTDIPILGQFSMFCFQKQLILFFPVTLLAQM